MHASDTSSWQTALDGIHPDTAFPIASSPHTGIKCLDCHDPNVPAPSVAGANTNCVKCHPDSPYQRDAHVGTRGPNGEAYEGNGKTERVASDHVIVQIGGTSPSDLLKTIGIQLVEKRGVA